MPHHNDPYLNAVRISFNEKKIKVRQEKIRQTEQKKESKKFLSRKIELDHYMNLPESIQNIIVFTLFIGIPYLLGIVFTFFVLAQASLDNYYDLDINSFPLTWSMGYECLAFLLLILIFKSSMCFRKC